MNIPTLGLDASPWSACWAVVRDAIVKNDKLKGPVKTWRVWDGGDYDATDLAASTLQQLPAVRLTPSGDPERWVTINQHDSPLVVTIELLVPGTRATDSMDLYWAITRALFPGDQSVYQKLLLAKGTNSTGGFMYELSSPAFAAMTVSDGQAHGGIGQLRVGLNIDTYP